MWYNIFIVIILVALAGTFAGLTLALFSLRLTTLEAKIKTGDKRAERIYKIRKKGNLLLCTLLLGNVASYTIMAIFLGGITSGVMAGFIATSLIFIFGEILPQAIFPRHALTIGDRLYWLIWIALILFYPVSAPIAWALNKIIGRETPVLWSKEELGEIIKLHEKKGKGIIDKDERRILLGALSFSAMTAFDVMIPRSDVFYLDAQSIIDKHVLDDIKARGFSRIPVYDTIANKLTGLIYAKNLIGIEPGKKAGELCVSANLIVIKENMKLDDLLNLLIKRNMQMALVTNAAGNFTGVAALEDIMEEILKTEIEDKKS